MPFSSAVATTKETLGVVREAVVILVVLAVVFSPGIFVRWASFFNEESRKAGATTEFSLGPLKLAFNDAAEQVSNLAAANEEVKKLSAQLAAEAADPRNAERRQELQRTAAALGSRIEASISSAKSTLLAQDQAIQDASGVTVGGGAYGVVVSADKRENLAEYEVKALRRRNLNDIAIYNRQQFLRTVARFANKEAAEERLPALQQYRQSAYVINLDKWCAGATESSRTIAGAPVFTCR